MTLTRGEQLCFCSVFSPFSRVGNSRLHCTRFFYLSFYGKCYMKRYYNSSSKSEIFGGVKHVIESIVRAIQNVHQEFNDFQI